MVRDGRVDERDMPLEAGVTVELPDDDPVDWAFETADDSLKGSANVGETNPSRWLPVETLAIPF